MKKQKKKKRRILAFAVAMLMLTGTVPYDVIAAAVPERFSGTLAEVRDDSRVSEGVVCEIGDISDTPVGNSMDFLLQSSYNSTSTAHYAIFSVDVKQYSPSKAEIPFTAAPIGNLTPVEGNENILNGYNFSEADLAKILAVNNVWDKKDWNYEIRTVGDGDASALRDRVVFHRNTKADAAAGGTHLIRFVHMPGSTNTGSTLGFVLPNGITSPGTYLTLTPSVINMTEIGTTGDNVKLRNGTGKVTAVFGWENVSNSLSGHTNTISASSKNGGSSRGTSYTKKYVVTDEVRFHDLYFSKSTVGEILEPSYNSETQSWECFAQLGEEKTLLLSVGGIPGNGTLPAGYKFEIKPVLDTQDVTHVTGFDVVLTRERVPGETEELESPYMTVTVNTDGDVLMFLGGSMNQQNTISNNAIFDAESLFNDTATSHKETSYELNEDVSVTKNVYKEKECQNEIKYATEGDIVYYKITADNNQREGDYFAIADLLGAEEDRISLTGIASVVIHHSGSEAGEGGTTGSGKPWDQEIKDIPINPDTPPVDKPYIVSLSGNRGSVLRNIVLHLKDKIEIIASAKVLKVTEANNPKAVNNAYFYEAPPESMTDEEVKVMDETGFKNVAMAHDQASLGVMNEVTSSSGATLKKTVDKQVAGPRGTLNYEITLENTTGKGQYLKCYDIWPENLSFSSISVSAGDGSDETANGQYAVYTDSTTSTQWKPLPRNIFYPGGIKISKIEFEGIYVPPATDADTPGKTTIYLGGGIDNPDVESVSNRAGFVGIGKEESAATNFVQVDIQKDASKISAKQVKEGNWDAVGAEKQVFKVGDVVRYSVTVKNKGKTDLKDITLTDPMNKDFKGSQLVEGKVGSASGKVLYQTHANDISLSQLPTDQWKPVGADAGQLNYTWKAPVENTDAGTLTIQNLDLPAGEAYTFYFFWEIGQSAIDMIPMGQTRSVVNTVTGNVTVTVDGTEKEVNLPAIKYVTLSNEGAMALKVDKRLVYTSESYVRPNNSGETSTEKYQFTNPSSVFGQESQQLSVVSGKKDTPAIAVYEVDIYNTGNAGVDISGFRDVAPKNMKLLGVVDQGSGIGSPNYTGGSGIKEIVANNSIQANYVAIPEGKMVKGTTTFYGMARGIMVSPRKYQNGREMVDITVHDLQNGLSPYRLEKDRVISLCLVYEVLDKPDDQNGTEQEGSNEYTNFFAVETGNSVTISDPVNNSYDVPIQPPRKDGLDQSDNTASEGKEYIWTYAKAGVRMYRPGIEKALSQYDTTGQGNWVNYSNSSAIDPGNNKLRWTLTLHNGTNNIDSVRKIDDYTVTDTLPWEFAYVNGTAKITYTTIVSNGQQSEITADIEPVIKTIQVKDEKGELKETQILTWYGGKGDSKNLKPEAATALGALEKGAGKVCITFDTTVKAQGIATYKTYLNQSALAVDPAIYPYSDTLESSGGQTGSIVCGTIAKDWSETHQILADVSVPLLGGSYTTSFKGVTNITEKQKADPGFVLDTDEEIEGVGAKQSTTDSRENNIAAQKGDLLTYTLRMSSSTAAANLTRDIIMIDQLPRIGDVGVLNRSEKRKSAFRMQFAEDPNVRVYLKGNGISGQAAGAWGVLLSESEYALQYGNTEGGTKAELGEEDWKYTGDTSQGGKAPGNTNVSWHDTLQEGDDCIRVSLKNAVPEKMTGDCSLTVAFDAKVPEDVTLSNEGNIAWNSFAYTYKIYHQNLSSAITTNIRSGPPKVGVGIPVSVLKVKKVVEDGSAGDQKFAFKLQAKTGNGTQEYASAGGVAYTVLDIYGGKTEYTTDLQTGEFKLKAGETATFPIASGNQYKVSELTNPGYELKAVEDIFNEEPMNGAAGSVNGDHTYETPAATDGKVYSVCFKNQQSNDLVIPETGGNGMRSLLMLGAIFLFIGFGYLLRNAKTAGEKGKQNILRRKRS